MSVDGGMSDNPRPVLYGSGYEAFLPRAAGAPAPAAGPRRGQALRVAVTSSWPTPACPPTSTVGDVLATPVTGAYGYSMASNYNKVPRPAVVFVVRRCGPGGRPARDARRPHPPRRLSAARRRHGPSRRREQPVPFGGDRRQGRGPGDGPATRTHTRRRRCAWPCSAAATSGGALVEILLHRRRRHRRPHGRPPRAGRGRRGRPGASPARRPSPTRAHRTDAAGARRDRDDVDVVVELIGGLDPARELVEAALRSGQAGGDRQQGAAGRRRRRAGRSWRPRPASTCSTRRPWPAPSRSSGRCASRWPASGSAASWGSSTARPTTS